MSKIFEFPDYDEIMRRNKEIYLDSIIDRYGEENRELLSRKFDEQSIYFFETPERLVDYVEGISKDELLSETINFLVELGIPRDSIFCENGCIQSKNKSISSKIIALLGYFQSLSIEHLKGDFGVLLFLENNEQTASTEVSKKEFLKKINYLDYLMYSKNKEKINEKYLKTAKLLQQHLHKVLDKYSPYLELAETIKKKDSSDYNYELKNFFFECREFLCKEDRDKIEKAVYDSVYSNEMFDFYQLKDYSFLLKRIKASQSGSVCPKLGYLFEPGLIESFDWSVSEKFNNFDPDDKKIINKRRIECLKHRGFKDTDLSQKYNLSSVDIASLPEVSEYIPSGYDVNKVKTAREILQRKTCRRLFSRYVVNRWFDSDLICDFLIDNISDSSINFCFQEYSSRSQIFYNTPVVRSSNIFLSPICSFIDYVDIVYDHEYTHNLEVSFYFSPEGYPVRKCGIEITTTNEKNEHKTKYKNLNETITQMLAIESTLKRYRAKQFIFEEPKDFEKIQKHSIYDKNIPKARVLVESLPPEFIKKRIEPTIDFIYEYFDEETWDELDSMIDNDKVSTEEFMGYIESKRSKSL